MPKRFRLSGMLLPLVLVYFITTAAGAAEKNPISPLANKDENYLALRGIGFAETFSVADLTIKRDIGVLRLASGRVTLAKPVLGRIPLAVFSGQGEFVFEPALSWEQRNLLIHTGSSSVRETFDGLVLWFTDDTAAEIRANGQAAALDAGAQALLQKLQSRLRTRKERPQYSLEAMLTGEDMDNVEADILTELHNPEHAGSFLAYIFGKKYSDLRFFVRPRSAMPQLISNEEVALVNYDPAGSEGGVWYLAHRSEEYANGGASQHKFPIDAKHYAIETTIQGNKQLDARCRVTFTATVAGERVIKFGLLPSLRVRSVRLGGNEIPFIQEPLKQDASFYAILPAPAAWGQDYELDIAYAGDDVITSEGGGNFAVGARTSWYPSLGSFKDRATFDLTFRYPKQFTLVSVGGLVEEKREKDFSVARWRSEVPLTVAGFNYGRFTKKNLVDEPTRYQIDGYAANEAPDFLRQFEVQDSVSGAFDERTAIGRLSPKRMMDNAMADTQVSMRLFTQYFGPLPFGRIAVTQQPQFSFGQSWPSLVYLPVSAFLDSTQRWAIMGSDAFQFADFIQEVTPHEVAHQWWGHVVGWDSYHDQWISEGFADFSAGLFLQAVRGKEQYLRFVEHWKEAILNKNRFGFAPNDVGPIWMGQRLHTAKTGDAYRKLIYPKGGYVLHMLRWMMYSPQKGDEAFIALMHDFVKSHHNKNATTESFQAVVERHMTNLMDLKGNRKMDWFFDQWVRGTEIPSYELRYKLTPLESGKSNLKFTVTQSSVSDDFVMAVPVYAEVQGKTFKLGMVGVKGNSTTSDFGGDMGFTPDRLFLNAHHDILANEIKVTPM